MGHRHSISSNAGDRQGLMRAYDEEEAAGFGLTDLAEDSDEDGPTAKYANGNGSAQGNNGNHESIELQPQKSTDR